MSHSPIKSQKSNSPSNLPAHFLVRVYDTKNSEVYQPYHHCLSASS